MEYKATDLYKSGLETAVSFSKKPKLNKRVIFSISLQKRISISWWDAFFLSEEIGFSDSDAFASSFAKWHFPLHFSSGLAIFSQSSKRVDQKNTLAGQLVHYCQFATRVAGIIVSWLEDSGTFRLKGCTVPKLTRFSVGDFNPLSSSTYNQKLRAKWNFWRGAATMCLSNLAKFATRD